MTLSEKSAYLKGLMEGMKLSTESDEGKMIAAIVELLGDGTKTLGDVQETTIAISDELDEIEDDLDAIEDFIMSMDEDEFDDYDDEDDEDYDFDDLEEGSIVCENCGETLEFSFDDDDEEELEF